MAKITLKGTPINTVGNLPTGKAPGFTLVKSDLSEISLSELKGKKVVINIFPSLDTSVCAASVRRFNKEAASQDNVAVVCVSKDLPFAHGRFCEAEGIKNVITASDFRDNTFSTDYGVLIVDGPLKGLLARSVVVVDEAGTILHSQLVPEIVQEPDYEAALSSLRKA
jgi:thiol peroxidase